MRRRTLLLFDRSAGLGVLAAAALREEFVVQSVDTLPRALAAIRGPEHHAFLVDVTGVADDPGLMFLRELRRNRDERVAVAISGNLDRELPALCYEAGAHGFIAKTHMLVRELRALLPRLLAGRTGALRVTEQRVDGIMLPRRCFRFGPAEIDGEQMVARFPGSTHSLNPKETGILHLLASRRGSLVRRSEILLQIWGPEAVPTSKSLDTYMSRLRRLYENEGIDFRSLVRPRPKIGWHVLEANS